jgi:quercetin dioxygenase-like cupin family protein
MDDLKSHFKQRKSFLEHLPIYSLSDWSRPPMVEYESPKHEDKPDKKREELKGRVIRLKDLVNYADGTVASRMIISRKAGNITLFSFDENEGLSEHTAPFDAVVTILDGECEVWIAGMTYQMLEGDTIIFPANVPHALSAKTKFKMSLSMIRE